MTADREAPHRFTSDPFRIPNGTTVVFRRVLETVEPDRMEGYLEVTSDGGTTWRRIYNQYLTRAR